jgi:hypothetical protein
MLLLYRRVRLRCLSTIAAGALIALLAACTVTSPATSSPTHRASASDAPLTSSSVAPLSARLRTSTDEGAATSNDAAAAAQNPIASNISLPLEASIYSKTGLEDDDAFVLNVQPVYPLSLGNWNAVNRLILPIMDLPSTSGGIPEVPGQTVGASGQSGLGDVNFTTFFSPADSSKITWGVGPSISAPTASSDQLGSGKWSAGPSIVALTIAKPWLVGTLVRQIWSFAGDGDRASVNQMIVQPFVNYNYASGWYLHSSPIFSSNWDQPSSERWTVPLGGGVGKILKRDGFNINMNVQYYYNVEKPTFGSDWQLRFVLAFILPRG